MLPTDGELSFHLERINQEMTAKTLAFPLTTEAAWRRYLEQTRDAEGEGYAEAEAEAWEELQAALARVRERRPDDAA